MEFRLQLGVRQGPAPVFVSFLPDQLLFLEAPEVVQEAPEVVQEAPEVVQETLPLRPFRVASAQTEALEYQPR